MKKRGIKLFLILLIGIFLIKGAYADGCILDATLVNQDPYPATPDNYVELLFQVSGVQNPSCKTVVFELVEKYPFSVIGEPINKLISGTYVYGYKNEWTIPYKLLVDKDAIDNDEEIEVVYYLDGQESIFTSKKFTIKIEDSIADFELHIKDYSYKTNELTIEILNIADVNVEALTLEIPKQSTIEIKGTNRVVIGDLDSNEYTTADFEGALTQGEIEVNVIYTDEIGIRRETKETLSFDPQYFTLSNEEQAQVPIAYYIILIAIVVLIIWWIVRRRKKKKERIMRSRGMAKL